MNQKIVIVEDEEDLLDLLEYNLIKEDFDVIGFLNTKGVENILEEENIDLLLMDRNLPDIEGSEFVKSLRENGIVVPVIYLSAKDKDTDIEEGFLSGGDDYLVKPFNMKELILRVKSIIRRTSSKVTNGTIRYKDILLDKGTRRISIDGAFIETTKLEFDLLHELILNKNTILDRDYLLQSVWEHAEENQYKTVNVAITRLKNKIDPHKIKNYIQTIRGIGYKLI